MVKRMLLMLALTAVFIAAIGFLKFRQVQEAIAQAASYQPPPEAVTTIVAKQEKWPMAVSAIGTVAAVQGVTVSADLPGIVDRIEFESGGSVSQGDVLVRLDTRQEQAQLAAAEAARELARLNFDRLQGLVSQRAISQADYDRAAAEQKQTEARVGEIRATIARKTITAPFSGILGIRQVNLGQYLSGGAPIVSLQKLDPIYVDFDLPQQYVAQVRIGSSVRISSGNGGARFAGQVTAVNAVVNENTRNIHIQSTLANPRGLLRPGMYVDTELILGASSPVVAVPASAVSYAPYGDSVFVVTDLTDRNGRSYRGVRQQFVKLGPARGDRVAVIAGLKPREEVVTSGVFKLTNGTAVFVNNKVQPSNEQAPKPEDR